MLVICKVDLNLVRSEAILYAGVNETESVFHFYFADGYSVFDMSFSIIVSECLLGISSIP